MKRQFFGTDGVRGPFNGPVINEAFAARLGEAAGRFFRDRGNPLVALLGRDTRSSGPLLVRALARGLAAAGATVLDAGILPTPALALATRKRGATLGVMVTASHNPAQDNGIKFFDSHGGKLTDEDESSIEALLPPAPSQGDAVLNGVDVVADYVGVTRALLPPGALSGMRLVLDAAHGATCATSRCVLESLGASVFALGHDPDGENINAGCGSEHPDRLAERVRIEAANLGIAHDGDGDRCVLCDENGNVLDGDEIVAILAAHAMAQGRLANNTVVVTQQSNLGLDAAVRAAGGRTLRTQVGDRYVLEGMRASGAILGGESSGHLVALDVTTTGDGLVAALKVLQVMLETGKPLSVLRRVLIKFPQQTAALKVREKRDLAALAEVQAVVRSLEAELGEQGRVLVRYSGTEPKIRLLVEGPSEAVVMGALSRLEAAVRHDLDVV